MEGLLDFCREGPAESLGSAENAAKPKATLRLVTIRRASPEELFRRKIETKEYETWSSVW